MLDAAGAAFAAGGFAATSMDEIAAAAGISKPMLYSYFGSKEGLYVAYLARSGAALLESMRVTPAEKTTPEERLRVGIEAFFDYVDDHRPGWAVLYQESASRGGPLSAELGALRDRIAKGVSRVFASEAFAQAYVGAGESLANWWLEHPDVPKEEVVELLLSVARVGLDLGQRSDSAHRATSHRRSSSGRADR
jgi:AcrR family transcriptional regulator